MEDTEHTDVLVVGGGPAGIGVAAALERIDVDVRILEQGEVGESFREWPAEMRFITPSFPSNGFGLPDLNAIVPKTSPAVALDCQQPSGSQYAGYLEAVVDHHDFEVATGVEVTDVTSLSDTVATRGKSESADAEQERSDGDTGQSTEAADTVAVDGGTAVDGSSGFRVETTEGTMESNFVVWAGGQFGAPRTDVFAGSERCRHNSTIDSWEEHIEETGADEFLIVGGFESGIDAAVNLVELGCSVTVLDRGHPWVMRHPDPSKTLSPYTLQRLDEVRHSDRLTLVGGADVERVTDTSDGSFEVVAHPVEEDPVREKVEKEDDESFDILTDGTFTVPTQPILATGFESNLGPVDEMFPTEDGAIELTARDESPTTSGLFLAGPDVEHEGNKFCFIYKFRSRFPIVAGEIGDRLDVDREPLEVYEDSNMFLEDLSCCEPVDCNC